MPKTIDYPRTSYLGAWEVAEVVDDTGGKCALETCARKLNRKVSGSFKAIVGSAVKFGLLTSKRELLTTTNLFRRIKHAYDKQEEKVFHREAFLHPPLFTQICRKFRNRELPVHMFDVMLIREFGVEEINAQNVSKAFVEGARMVSILDERNVVADIDQLAAAQQPRRELASTEMPVNLFRAPSTSPPEPSQVTAPTQFIAPNPEIAKSTTTYSGFVPNSRTRDAISSLFGLDTDDLDAEPPQHVKPVPTVRSVSLAAPVTSAAEPFPGIVSAAAPQAAPASIEPEPTERPKVQAAGSNNGQQAAFTLRINGPGIDTQLLIQDSQDLELVSFLLEKIRKQLVR